jgi:AcrR family transcriptional regulator
MEQKSTKDILLAAGLDELNKYGISGFSTRRVAKNCGISCATPYKHFSDTKTFITEILIYINKLYYERQKNTIEKFKDSSLREQLVELSVDYIRFLVEYPEFRKVIMQNFDNCDEEYKCLRGQLSSLTYDVVSDYCKSVNMPPDVRKRKVFIIRSIIYGGALFFDNSGMEYNEENMAMIRDMLEREFDLP